MLISIVLKARKRVAIDDFFSMGLYCKLHQQYQRINFAAITASGVDSIVEIVVEQDKPKFIWNIFSL